MPTLPEIARETAGYLVGSVGIAVVGFATTLVYSRTLGPSDFGLYSLLLSVSGVSMAIMMLGGDVVLSRFWFDDAPADSRRRFTTTWIVTIAFWSMALAAMASTALLIPAVRAYTDRIAPTEYVLAVVWTAVLVAVGRMLAQILRNRFRPYLFSLSTVLPSACALLVGVLLIPSLGVLGVILGLVAAGLVSVAVGLALNKSSLGLRLDFTRIPAALRLGLPLVPASLSFWVFGGLDRVALANAVPLAALGAYALSVQLVAPLTLLMGAVSQAWVPRILQLGQSSRRTSTLRAYESSLLAACAYSTMAAILSASAPALLLIVGGREYMQGAQSLPLLATGAAALGVSLFAGTPSLIVKKTALAPLITGTAAIADIALLALTVPRLGIRGAALSTMSAYLLLLAGNIAYSRRVNAERWRPLALISVIGVLVVQSLVASILPGSITSITASVAAIAFFGVIARWASKRKKGFDDPGEDLGL